jgi:lysophospholipase L1-like esterase
VAAHGPGFVIVEVGTNDIVAADASADAVMANIEAMCRHNRLIGAYTILSTISVRGSGNGSGWGGLATANAIARRNRINQVNRRILELDLPGVFPVDVNRYWADPASAVRRG